jgi:hypothetical protein
MYSQMVKIINKSFSGGPLYYEGNYYIHGIPDDELRNMDLASEMHEGGPIQASYYEPMIYDKVRKYCHDHGLIFENDLSGDRR